MGETARGKSKNLSEKEEGVENEEKMCCVHVFVVEIGGDGEPNPEMLKIFPLMTHKGNHCSSHLIIACNSKRKDDVANLDRKGTPSTWWRRIPGFNDSLL